mgnify:CR=1 FL=1
MSRLITITKVGKSTIVDVQENSLAAVETFVFNKDTNLTLGGNVVTIETTENRRLNFQYEVIVNKLSSTDLRSYLTKASEAFLFNH